jgi:hypothetical protein
MMSWTKVIFQVNKSVYEVQGESAPPAAALALDKPKFFSM